MKSVVLHGVLALLGLSWAYQTWTRPPETEQPASIATAVTIAECEEAQLASLEVETPTHMVTIKPKRGGNDNQYWVTTQRRKPPEETKPEQAKPADPVAQGAAGSAAGPTAGAKAASDPARSTDPAKPADPAAPADPAKPAEPEKKKEARPYDPDAPVTFLANAKFDELLKSLTPLRAVRSLGPIPKDKYAQFGFDKVGTYLRMQCGGRKVALDIGGRTYGSGDRYARDPKGKESYLLEGRIITDLQSAQFKFMQSELHDFALTDVDEAVISAKGMQRKLLHRNRLVKEEARWVDAAQPDRRNELFGNWFERLGRLKAKAYLGEGQQPGADLKIAAGPAQPVLAIEYRLEGKPKDKLEIVRVETEQGAFYYGRSGTTRRWVSMYDSLAKQVDEDVAMVVGAEEAPAESTTAPATGPAETGASRQDAVDPHVPPNPHAAPASPHGGAATNPHAMPPTRRGAPINPHGAAPANPHAMPPSHP
jgi:hypothetical protein